MWPVLPVDDLGDASGPIPVWGGSAGYSVIQPMAMSLQLWLCFAIAAFCVLLRTISWAFPLVPTTDGMYGRIDETPLLPPSIVRHKASM